VDLPGSARHDDAVQGLRHRGARRGRVHGDEAADDLQLGAGDGGQLDTAHISHLHQFDGIDDIPDDGSDKPGYPSNAMSWKFWRRDRAPRLELEETWYGYRYAGVRSTPNGNTHVRVTAYAVPYSTMVASIPFSVGHGMFVPIDDENCWRYFVAPKVRQLGSTDRAITRNAAHLSLGQGPGRGKGAAGVAARLDYRSIRGAEKILEPGEDWRTLGTADDPVVREALGVD
jgi:LigXa C-terminal domain like